MTIYENGQAKDVFVVRKDIEGTEYWVPVKVDVNKMVFINMLKFK